MALLTWSYSRGRPRGLTHEDVLKALLTRASSWPYSRGRPRGLTHEDLLVALLKRMSSWLLHEDAYNRQTRGRGTSGGGGSRSRHSTSPFPGACDGPLARILKRLGKKTFDYSTTSQSRTEDQEMTNNRGVPACEAGRQHPRDIKDEGAGLGHSCL